MHGYHYEKLKHLKFAKAICLINYKWQIRPVSKKTPSGGKRINILIGFNSPSTGESHIRYEQSLNDEEHLFPTAA